MNKEKIELLSSAEAGAPAEPTSHPRYDGFASSLGEMATDDAVKWDDMGCYYRADTASSDAAA